MNKYEKKLNVQIHVKVNILHTTQICQITNLNLQIYEYIDKIAEQYPETVTLVQNSTSFEGRPLKYLKISNDNFMSNKPVIYIDGGIHAREWISPPTVTYAIHKLVENVTEPDLLDKFDWILFPIVNPDGYYFSYNTVSKQYKYAVSLKLS